MTDKLEGYDNSDILEIEKALKHLKKLLMKISNSMNLIKNLARDEPNELKIVKKLEDIADFIEMNAESMNINFQKKINDLQKNYFFTDEKAKKLIELSNSVNMANSSVKDYSSRKKRERKSSDYSDDKIILIDSNRKNKGNNNTGKYNWAVIIFLIVITLIAIFWYFYYFYFTAQPIIQQNIEIESSTNFHKIK